MKNFSLFRLFVKLVALYGLCALSVFLFAVGAQILLNLSSQVPVVVHLTMFDLAGASGIMFMVVLVCAMIQVAWQNRHG